MDDAARVGGLEGVGDVLRQVEQHVDRQRSAIEPVLERLAVQPLHRDERPVAVAPDFVDGADVGMVERRCRPGLTQQPRLGLGRRGDTGREELQGDLPPECRVFGQIDDAHAAAAERFEHAIV